MMPAQGVPFVVSALLHAAVLALPAHEPAAPTRPGVAPAARLLATLHSPPPVTAPPASAAPTPARMAAVRSTEPPRPTAARPPTTPATPVPQHSTPDPAPAATTAAPGVSPAPADVAAVSPATESPANGATAALVEEVPPHHHADYLNNPKPVYPKFARDRGQQGRVLLAVHVGSDGRPLAVKLAASSGFPLLDNAAREAVAGWRFVPARRGQTAVDAWAQVPIAFGLAQP